VPAAALLPMPVPSRCATAAFYPFQVIKKQINHHLKSQPSITLLTAEKKDPYGLGRIIRDKSGKITGIVEEKNTTEEQKKIKEINTGCYCFDLKFIKKYLPQIKKDKAKGEYYLTDIVDIAIKNNKKVTSIKASRGEYFQGINTRQQLEKADARMQKFKK
jgi:bifunctional UDP-N-acetylglucosamine pyrophosphorylase / glucosamine-1-phosphate N-acetyltransferase